MPTPASLPRSAMAVRLAARVAPAAAALLLALTVTAPAAAQPRPITETDLFDFVWVADPQLSPDGTQVAFVRVTADRARDQYVTALWIVDTDGRSAPRPLSAGPRDSSPRWSPDGRRLAFARVEQDGKTQPPQIYVLDLRGGEAMAVTAIPRGAGNPAWSPDGRTIAFSGTARPDELPGAAPAKPAGEHVSDVRVVTDAVYRANGVGATGFVEPDRPTQIWTVAIAAPGAPPAAPRQLTSGEFDATGHQWSRDGTRLFFVSDRRKASYYLPNDSDLYTVDAAGGEPRRVASIDGNIGAFAESRDGRRVAFVGTLHGEPERSYSQSDLWVIDLPSGTPRNLTTAYDFDINGGVSGDQRAPRGAAPAGPLWSADGTRLIVRAGIQGDANLIAVDAGSGAVTPVTDGPQDVMAYTASADGSALAYIRSTPTVLGDLHTRAVAASGTGRRLTSFNDPLFGRLTMDEPEAFWFDSADGTRIQGWILKPPGFDASRKYPLILEIHGGPHSAYGNTFTHEFQWMAAKGYVVLYTNPRGSSNYGQDFGNRIQFAYPGDDYTDLMAGVDAVLARGYVDDTRLGVTGGSGGGLLTNWVVTRTTRFKAAVSQRDIADWANFWYTADFTLFTPTWFRKAPFEDPADYARRSPITYVDRIRTPLMFILGDEDFRTPPGAGGEDLFRALKYLKRPTVMVRFPNESHELSRSGKPWHRVERLRHILGWFDLWLLGKDAGTYDLGEGTAR